jgi:hypothetical protein
MWIAVFIVCLFLGGAILLWVLSRRIPWFAAVMSPFKQWLHGLGGALEEAATILEGEGSLIWLLLVILLFLLLR